MANWIAGAIKHKGRLRAKAKRAGLLKGNEKLSSSDLGKLGGKGASTETKREVNLARTLKKLRKR